MVALSIGKLAGYSVNADWNRQKMNVTYMKGITTHHGHESCLGSNDGSEVRVVLRGESRSF